MTPIMPEAPQPPNRMMAPQGAGMAPDGFGPGAAPMAAPNAMMAPGGAPVPPGPPPTPEEIMQSRKHVGVIMDGLLSLTSKPRGDLTKKDVFEAASEMIAKGAFPTPDSRQDLVVRLAALPDDEVDLRKALGQMLLGVASARGQLHETFGPGDQAAPMPGAPNAGI